jgi:hypothetical protein
MKDSRLCHDLYNEVRDCDLLPLHNMVAQKPLMFRIQGKPCPQNLTIRLNAVRTTSCKET